jgi:transposase
VGDVTQAPTLLEGQAGDAVLADKAYDSNALRAGIGAAAVIPSNRSRKTAIPHDAVAYKQRNRIERCVQILLGHSKIENTVRYLRIDVEDALALAENTEI